jgi:Tol biopolymer transport system component
VAEFAWSPDGRQVAYLAQFEETYELWVATVGEAGGPGPLTEGAHPFAVRWLPTGQILLLGSWGTDALEVRVVDPATGEAEPLPHGAASGSFREIRFFDVSADGRWIVFVEDDRQGDVWLLEATEGSF